MELNSTPVRTCKNYNINDIEFSEKIPNKFKKFENLKIFKDTEKDEVITDFKFNDFDIKYGTGLIDQIKNSSNQNIRVNVNSKTNKDIKLEFDFDEKSLELVENIEINIEPETTSNIYIIYRQRTSGKAFHNGLIRVLSKSNSKSIITIVNLMNPESSNVLSIDGKLEDGSKLKYNIVDFGGKTSITNLYTNLLGKESQNLINSIYLGSNDEKIDINYIAECFGEKTKIDIDVQGALKDNAKKSFKGTIDFKNGCKHSKGIENENCTILSDTAKSKSLPMLLCKEEDVEGEHGVSSGKIDESKLFYIMTKGISKKNAKKLIVKANFNKIINEIDDETLQRKILESIDKNI